jgi:hypothetical protein
MLRDWKKVYRKIQRVRGFDEHEKILYARSLAATPDERWQLNVTFLRSLGLWGHNRRKSNGNELAARHGFEP